MHVMCYAKWHENARCYNLETTYTYACECMYGMYYARWHEKTLGWILCIIRHESRVDPWYVSSECKNVIYLKNYVHGTMNEDKMWM